jgi:hypothetical protein
MSRKNHPRRANPACPTRFRWNAGGRFFRSRLEPAQTTDPQSDRPPVEHYWLCEVCSHLFTLVCDQQLGVVLKVGECPHPEVNTQTMLTAA